MAVEEKVSEFRCKQKWLRPFKMEQFVLQSVEVLYLQALILTKSLCFFRPTYCTPTQLTVAITQPSQSR